jgi:hypothetical protein
MNLGWIDGTGDNTNEQERGSILHQVRVLADSLATLRVTEMATVWPRSGTHARASVPCA